MYERQAGSVGKNGFWSGQQKENGAKLNENTNASSFWPQRGCCHAPSPPPPIRWQLSTPQAHPSCMPFSRSTNMLFFMRFRRKCFSPLCVRYCLLFFYYLPHLSIYWRFLISWPIFQIQ